MTPLLGLSITTCCELCSWLLGCECAPPVEAIRCRVNGITALMCLGRRMISDTAAGWPPQYNTFGISDEFEGIATLECCSRFLISSTAFAWPPHGCVHYSTPDDKLLNGWRHNLAVFLVGHLISVYAVVRTPHRKSWMLVNLCSLVGKSEAARYAQKRGGL